MNFESELISGLFIKRYKRFFVDIKIKNQIIVAHCPNSGSMLNLLDKGNPVWLTKSNNEKRFIGSSYKRNDIYCSVNDK